LLQNISYKDKSLKLESKADRVVVKEEQKVETEKEALAQVGGWAAGLCWYRLSICEWLSLL
jgi:hypothetical protein